MHFWSSRSLKLAGAARFALSIFGLYLLSSQPSHAGDAQTETITAVATAQSIAATQNDNASVDKQLKKLLKELAKTQENLDRQHTLKSKAVREFKQAEIALGEANKQLRASKSKSDQLTSRLQHLKSEQTALEKQAKTQRALIAQAVRAAYFASRNNPIVDILSQKNPASANRDQVYIDYIAQARMQKIAKYQALIEKHHVVSAQINEDKTELDLTLNLLEQQAQKLKALQKQRNQLIATISHRIDQDQQRVSILKADREALQQLIDSIQVVVEREESQSTLQQYSQQWDNFALAKGKLPWPVNGKLSSHFGGQQQNSDIKWPGVAIVANSGEPVRAIYPGTVIFSDWFKGLGLLLIVDHGNGYWSLYGRNQSILSKSGTIVSAGETIATVGSSGDQGDPALYFEVRHNGQPDNPKKWCTKR